MTVTNGIRLGYCPISGKRITDPYVTDCGHTFQKEIIEKWVSDHRGLKKATCPLDGKTITVIRPNMNYEVALIQACAGRLGMIQTQMEEELREIEQEKFRRACLSNNRAEILNIIENRMRRDLNVSVFQEIPLEILQDSNYQGQIVARAKKCLIDQTIPEMMLKSPLQKVEPEFITQNRDFLMPIVIGHMAKAGDVRLFCELPLEVRNHASFVRTVIFEMRRCHIGGAEGVLRNLSSEFVLQNRDLVMEILVWYGETHQDLSIFPDVPEEMRNDLTFTRSIVRQVKVRKIPSMIRDILPYVPDAHREILRKDWENSCTIL